VAGPSIFVRFLGDAAGLNKAFDQTATKGASTAKSLHGAFSGALGAINQTGVLGPFGAALSTVDAGMGKISGHVKDIGPSFIAAGAGAAGLGLTLSALGSKDAAAHAQLQAAVGATGHSYDQYAGKVEEAIKHQEHFGNTADATQDSLRILTQATGSPTKALQLLNTATDLAAAKHEDLTTASTQLGRAYNGSAKIFKEYGIQVTKVGTAQKVLQVATKTATADDVKLSAAKRSLAELEAQDATKKSLTTVEAMKLKDAQDKVTGAALTAYTAHGKLNQAQKDAKDSAANQSKGVEELSKKLKGQGAAAADTFSGRLKALKAQISDNIAQFGQKYGPAITAAGAAMTGLGATIEVVKAASKALRLAALASAVAEGIATVATAIWDAALGVAATLEAIVGAPIWLIIAAVLAFVAAIAAAAFFIIKYWSDISGAFVTAYDVIAHYIGVLISVIAAIPGQIAAIAVTMWHWISDWFGVALNAITTAWSVFWGWLSGIPGAVAAIAGQFWHWISDQFRNVVAGVQLIWAGFWGWFTGLPGAIAGVAGQMWHWISDQFNNVLVGIQLLWSGFWGWFTGLGAAIDRVASGMWNGIANAFVAALNWLIDRWNDLHFKTPSIDILGFHTPSVDIGLPPIPHIPHLAQGGLITETGLILAHAGEAITPAPQRALGPAVNIESVTLASELDVDSFTRRLAWNVRTAAI
jgi:hypothetical protein